MGSLNSTRSAALGTHFKFVPLDVGGHILCPLEWTADKNITTSVPPQSIGVNVTLARGIDAGALTYRGKLDELPIKLHFQPSPLSLVLRPTREISTMPNLGFQLQVLKRPSRRDAGQQIFQQILEGAGIPKV
jgi:hypothetical protein